MDTDGHDTDGPRRVPDGQLVICVASLEVFTVLSVIHDLSEQWEHI